MSSAGIPHFPFGAPDGATELRGRFVPLPEVPAYQPLIGGELDSSARLVIGRMGAGKSAYLSELRAAVEQRDDYVVASVESELPNVASIRAATEFFDKDGPYFWKKTWRRAITRALASHLCHHEQLRGSVSPERLRELRDADTRLLAIDDFSRGVYEHVDEMLRDHNTRGRLRGFLSHEGWATVDRLVERALETSTVKIAFFLDAGEHECATEPLYWIKFQRGLFAQILSMAKQPAFAGKVHVVASIRDATYARIEMSSGDAKDHPFVRVLDWTVESAHAFLRQKIQQLDKRYAMSDPEREGIEGWLGRTTVRNKVRGIDEPVDDYLLRHTRLLPRDIVNLGNRISQQCVRERRLGATAVDEEALRDIVRLTAAEAGLDQLMACANVIATRRLELAGTEAERRAIVPDEDAVALMRDRLRDMVCRCRDEQVPGGRIEELRKEGEQRWGADIDITNLLWQHGLLGACRDRDEPPTFAALDYTRTSSTLPADALAYVFHPCLTDAADLRVKHPEPVRAYRSLSS
jgi:hypothetical protein